MRRYTTQLQQTTGVQLYQDALFAREQPATWITAVFRSHHLNNSILHVAGPKYTPLLIPIRTLIRDFPCDAVVILIH